MDATVVSVIGAPDWGGLQAVVERTTPFIVGSGFRRVVVCPTYKSTTITRLAAAGAKVISYYPRRLRRTWNPLVHLQYLLVFPLDVARLCTIFRRERADIVEVSGLLNIQPVLAALLVRKPLIWQLHSTLAPRPARLVLGAVCSLIADAIMTSGSGMISKHGGIAWRGSRAIGFCAPLDAREFHGDPEIKGRVRSVWGYSPDEIVVGTLGNRGWQKNHEMLVHVAARMKGIDPRLRFAIVGTPLVDNNSLYEKKVLDKIAQLGLDRDGYVRIIDQDRSSQEIMNCFDIFALTSVAEGASLVTAEAMATSLPIVSTDVGSLSDIVVPGKNGFLVPVDDYDSMASAIRTLLNERMRERMGLESRRIIESDISDEKCAETHIQTYRALLAKR